VPGDVDSKESWHSLGEKKKRWCTSCFVKKGSEKGRRAPSRMEDYGKARRLRHRGRMSMQRKKGKKRGNLAYNCGSNRRSVRPFFHKNRHARKKRRPRTPFDIDEGGDPVLRGLSIKWLPEEVETEAERRLGG